MPHKPRSLAIIRNKGLTREETTRLMEQMGTKPPRYPWTIWDDILLQKLLAPPGPFFP